MQQIFFMPQPRIFFSETEAFIPRDKTPLIKLFDGKDITLMEAISLRNNLNLLSSFLTEKIDEMQLENFPKQD